MRARWIQGGFRVGVSLAAALTERSGPPESISRVESASTVESLVHFPRVRVGLALNLFMEFCGLDMPA